MRIAHLSDLHFLSLEEATPARLLNKRLTGYLNLRMRRAARHRASLVRALAEEIRRLEVDHVVVTGDVSTLALEGEFQSARTLFEEHLGLRPEAVSVVPGNHDLYTKGSMRARRFAGYLEPYARSDLPELAAPCAGGSFPFVRLRGPAAIIGLSTAVPRPPLVASGRLGEEQRYALARVLAHPEVQRRTPVLLQHHPPNQPGPAWRTYLGGLVDAAELLSVLRPLRRGLLLHGHLHRRQHRRLPTLHGHLDVVGATSASLLDPAVESRMAGFNLYQLGPDGALLDVSARVLDPEGRHFATHPVPTA